MTTPPEALREMGAFRAFTLTRWDRFKMWLEYDVWCWLINAPMSDPAGGHCTGRRSGQPVYCPDCDGPSERPRIGSN